MGEEQRQRQQRHNIRQIAAQETAIALEQEEEKHPLLPVCEFTVTVPTVGLGVTLVTNSLGAAVIAKFRPLPTGDPGALEQSRSLKVLQKILKTPHKTERRTKC